MSYRSNLRKIFVGSKTDLMKITFFDNGKVTFTLNNIKAKKGRVAVSKRFFTQIAQQLKINYTILLCLKDTYHKDNEIVPILVFSKRKNSNCINIPDTYFMRNYSKALSRVVVENTNGTRPSVDKQVNLGSVYHPWSTKINSCIWRGTPTSNNCQHWQDSFRCEVCMKFLRSETLNFKLVSTKAGRKEIKSGLFSPWISIEKQMKSKFLLNMDGQAAAFDSMYWKLKSNCLVFYLTKDEWTQWYYNKLKPYQHYIPCTIQDVEEKVNWAIQHTNEAMKIANASRELMDNEVRFVDGVEYTKQTILSLFKKYVVS